VVWSNDSPYPADFEPVKAATVLQLGWDQQVLGNLVELSTVLISWQLAGFPLCCWKQQGMFKLVGCNP
jgi:hypothetical protein